MFGRKIQFDDRSRNFALEKTGDLRSYTWRCNANLNQGTEGACVGFAIGNELAARPAEASITNEYARQIYLEAQKIDPWPGGSYPGASPIYEGTSVLAGVKVAQRLGWFDSYYWAFNTDSLLYNLGRRGPCVIGINWYEGMYNTNESGFIVPTGNVVGGHAILVNSVSVKNEYVKIHNSWGKHWGENGSAKLTFDHLNELLEQRGEAVFFLKRKTRNE